MKTLAACPECGRVIIAETDDGVVRQWCEGAPHFGHVYRFNTKEELEARIARNAHYPVAVDRCRKALQNMDGWSVEE